MSFSVNVKETNIEYCGKGLNGIFSNKKNLFNFLNLNKNFVAQPLVKGVSYSANVIPIKNKVFILNFNKQEISYGKKKIVFLA